MVLKTVPNRARLQPSPVVISNVLPNIDCASTSIKRTLDEKVTVSAEIVATSPFIIGGVVRFRPVGRRTWERVSLTTDSTRPDWYFGEFKVSALGRWQYSIEAWVDCAATWRNEIQRRVEGGQIDLHLELEAANQRFGTDFTTPEEALTSTFEDQQGLTRSPTFLIDVDPKLARFGAWYEMFPRSFGGFEAIRKHLADIADAGFDVIYLPPIHPIGQAHRKGQNNALTAQPDDPGSPWAIGDRSGGHTAIDKGLGSIKEFGLFVQAARELDISIALDLALQCSPDHPWLREHPEWFAWRPDGTVQYAENPPKRYEDIVNFDFDSEAWPELWGALLAVVRFWIDHGIRVFRVDNPHTKPLKFWEWLIAEVRAKHPDVFFLAEAFTRPALMSALAKVGFSQSYTYFTWRNTAEELTSYLRELAGEMHEYFRPNFFVNTPDILSVYLQDGGPPAFHARIVLAATLSPSYGLYSGFENYENVAYHAGSEEYLDSEKYEIKSRQFNGPLLPLIGRLNEIRRSTLVFERLDNVFFLTTANSQIIAYVKHNRDEGVPGELFIICVNLDPTSTQEGLVVMPAGLGLPIQFVVEDLLHDKSYTWSLGDNYVRLEPGAAHVLRVK